jgi:hypothetical protein
MSLRFLGYNFFSVSFSLAVDSQNLNGQLQPAAAGKVQIVLVWPHYREIGMNLEGEEEKQEQNTKSTLELLEVLTKN